MIVHLSDIHFGAHRQELVECLLADIAARQPNLVVVSGDLTQRARPGQFEQARAFLDRMPGPVLTVIGNHDLPLFNVPRRFLTQSRRYERFVTTELDPVVVLPGLTALGLDTMPAWRWKAGHVSPRQAAIVRDAFDNTPVNAWRLLVTHHPVLPSSLSGLAGRTLLVDTCAQAGVALLLSGHTHTASADIVPLGAPGTRRSALAMVAGTAISKRTRGTANSYGVLDLSGPMEAGTQLTFEIRQAVGTEWSGHRSERFEYTAEGVVARGRDRP